jgi:LysR family hydrogen peroxide-inducible transcriptional activator
VAIKKLEDELGVVIFERGGTEVSVTPLGAQIVAQAERVLEQTAAIKEIANQNKDPLSGPLRLGIIYTIGPYLLPSLVKTMIERVPQMPLILQENFTTPDRTAAPGRARCGHHGPALPRTRLERAAAVRRGIHGGLPRQHKWAERKKSMRRELKSETMLLLGNGHCFRDQVLEVCPEMSRFSTNGDGIARTFEGSSLETIRHMVSSGIGVTVLPRASIPMPIRATAWCATYPSWLRHLRAAWSSPGARALRGRPPSMPCIRRCWRASSMGWRCSPMSRPARRSLHKLAKKTGLALRGPCHFCQYDVFALR